MATSESDTAQQYTRISDINKEPLEMHMPIRGFERMPLVPLEEAIQPLFSILPEIQDYAFVAKQRAKPTPADGLSRDESASIILYSMEWEPHEECLYFALNAALRLEDRRKLKPWFSYLKLFLTALAKIPSTSRTIYRGIKLDLSKEYPEGKTFVWWGFSSCTASIKVLENEEFLGQNGQRTLFAIECDSGKDISQHSYYQSEKEILLSAARQFTVESTFRPAPDLHIIQLKETKSQITLISTVASDFHSNKPLVDNAPVKKPEPVAIPIAPQPVKPEITVPTKQQPTKPEAAATYPIKQVSTKPKETVQLDKSPKSQEFATPGTYKPLYRTHSILW